MANTSGTRLDWFGAEGVSGLPAYSGYVYDEFLAELQGPRGRRVLREMADNDAIVGAVLFSVEMLVRGIDWWIEPDPDAPEDDERPEFVDSCRNDMAVTWPNTLSEILSMLPYGFSWHEQIFKRRNGIDSQFADGLIGWHSWPMRGQETLLRWEFGDMGEILGMWQLGPPDFKLHFIPREKSLHFRTSTKRGNPEGRPIIRNAYRSWFLKKKIEQIEAIGVERDLVGLPMARIPMEYLAEDATLDQQALRAQIFKIVTQVRRNESDGIVWPIEKDERGEDLWTFELLTSGGQRQFNTDAIIARYDQRILMSVMADMIMLGHENVGSNALAQSKGKLFTAALGAWIDAITAEINDVAIPRLLRLNGMCTDLPPRLVHGDIERPDLDIMGNFLLHLAQAGFELDTRFDSELTARLMQIAGLPEPPEDPPTSLHEWDRTDTQPVTDTGTDEDESTPDDVEPDGDPNQDTPQEPA